MAIHRFCPAEKQVKSSTGNAEHLAMNSYLIEADLRLITRPGMASDFMQISARRSGPTNHCPAAPRVSLQQFQAGVLDYLHDLGSRGTVCNICIRAGCAAADSRLPSPASEFS